MSKPLQIGITGGIGSGKSLVCRIFHCLGVPVYDADSHAKNLMTTDGILVSNIKKEFGELSYNTDGSLNRKFLSETVFGDSAKLEVLNHLVHPRVALNYSEWVSGNGHYPYVMKEAALLYESASYKQLDKIIVVAAPEELRIERTAKRDPQRSREQIRAIISQQMTQEEKLKRADFVIDNGETTLLIPQVVELHRTFLTAR